MSKNLQTLIEKLDPTCRKGLETAAELCVSQTNYNVELEHLLLKLLELPDTDIQKLLRYYEIPVADLNRELTRSIDRFRRGNSRTPALSPYILQLIEQAWLLSSLHFKADLIRSGAIFQVLLEHDTLRGVILESAPSLKNIPREAVKKEFAELLRAYDKQAGVQEEETGGKGAEGAVEGQPPPSDKRSKTPSLDRFTIDLTARAAQGLIDPIYGRDAEIRQLIDILSRRRQNNPILTGEPGVGKTAVVEGFAIRIAEKNVPPALANISLRMLDLALLQAGAGIRGEFEKRLKSVIDEVKGAPRPIILFIDEAHTMIGAGGAAGQGDAANLLKPVLARGELRTIAATTWAEYKKYFEKDPALARRFQVVKVEEPDEAATAEMLRGVVAKLEAHHGVTVLDEAVWDAARLSKRYITGRQLPDSAISVLDTACARVSVGLKATPPEIEDAIKRGEQIALELAVLKREQNSGLDHSERIEALESELEAVGQARESLEKKWQEELSAVGNVIAAQEKMTPDDGNKGLKEAEAEKGRKALMEAKATLENLQGEAAMVPLHVDAGVIARVISNWTGIPVGKMLTDEIDTVLTLKEKMETRIIGQSRALDAICRRIRTFRADLDDPGKPVGVFLLVGPSGIGKTETALTLADLLYGGERNMITINMSEYQEPYTVSGLKGAPPGYVGHGKGGVLTEAVRQNPYSVVLLDEVEKAHPDVLELFYQVFDKGMLEDAEGLTVDFKNTIIFLTSNVGTETILDACLDDEEPVPELDELVEMIRPDLVQYFKAAFLGRLVIVPYYPLTDEVIQQIAVLKLDKIKERFLDNHRIDFDFSQDLVTAIADRCTEVDSGARNVDHLLTQTLLPELSGELLRRMGMGQICTGIHAGMDADGDFSYRFTPPLGPVEDADAQTRLDGPADRSVAREVQEGAGSESIRELLDATVKNKKGLQRPRKIDGKSKRWRSLLDRL